MEIKEFAKKICLAMEHELGEDSQVVIRQVIKNNSVKLTGIMISENARNVMTTIYLEHFWQEYEKGAPLSVVAENILRLYHRQKPCNDVDMDFFTDYEKVKDRICYRLIGREQNGELLEEIPYIEFFDLAICFFYAYEGEELGEGSILIHKKHMDTWQINLSDLFEQATINTPRLLPWECQKMDMVLEDMQEMYENGEISTLLQDVPMRVLSNSKRVHGASCLLYPGVLQQLAVEQGGNYYILPSSIHEVILLKDGGAEDEERLKWMVYTVNKEIVDREEILSDSLYYYDFGQKTLRKVP